MLRNTGFQFEVRSVNHDHLFGIQTPVIGGDPYVVGSRVDILEGVVVVDAGAKGVDNRASLRDFVIVLGLNVQYRDVDNSKARTIRVRGGDIHIKIAGKHPDIFHIKQAATYNPNLPHFNGVGTVVGDIEAWAVIGAVRHQHIA